MATTALRRDHLLRKIVNPTTNALDHIGRATTATADYTGRPLVGKLYAVSTAFVVGEHMEHSTGVVLVTTVAGTTDAVAGEPAAPGYNNTVSSGTVTWRQITTA